MEMNDRPIRSGPGLRVALVVIALAAAGITASAQAPAPSSDASSADTSNEPRDPPPPLPATVLKDPQVIATGEALWKDNGQHCHGSKAYPGKAPKLQPHKYKPEFVWDRVHNGFRSMPPWKELYKPDEVIALVAWVMSDEFWP
jgi:mono/diheme cytochrome c family protein